MDTRSEAASLIEHQDQLGPGALARRKRSRHTQRADARRGDRGAGALVDARRTEDWIAADGQRLGRASRGFEGRVLDGGLTLESAYVVGEGCFPGKCELHGDFYIMESGGVARRFDRSGTYSFRLSDFQEAPWGEPGLQLDTTHVAGMFFHLPTGEFDFCLNDFHFLDVNGAPVL